MNQISVFLSVLQINSLLQIQIFVSLAILRVKLVRLQLLIANLAIVPNYCIILPVFKLVQLVLSLVRIIYRAKLSILFSVHRVNMLISRIIANNVDKLANLV